MPAQNSFEGAMLEEHDFSRIPHRSTQVDHLVFRAAGIPDMRQEQDFFGCGHSLCVHSRGKAEAKEHPGTESELSRVNAAHRHLDERGGDNGAIVENLMSR